MNVLVVGGAGFIGSHVCQELKAAGIVPVTYDNLSSGHSWAVQFGPFVLGDLADPDTLYQTMITYRPQVVIHLASLINVREAILHPALYYEKNLGGALNLLNAMRRADILRIVFSSTAAIYGAPHYVPIDEKHPKAPLNAYGKTKWAIEGMLEDFAAAYGLQFATLRYFNACGADLEGKIGEAHQPETHLIPLVIQTAMGLKEGLDIYGDDYPTPDGTAIRDYVHVLDLARAHCQALQYLFSQKGNIQVNLGTGAGYSVRQIIQAVEVFSQRRIPVRTLPRLPQDSPILVANPQEAREKLQWEPRFSDLATILKTAWQWQELLSQKIAQERLTQLAETAHSQFLKN